MTLTAELNDGYDAANALLRTTLLSIEWIRRRLDAVDHPSRAVLDRILASSASSPDGAPALAHPWTTAWIEVAVRLLDRGALTLLPDGQLAAHLGQATNLLAALRIGQEPVSVRLNRQAIGWLPGTGAIVAGDLASAGLACTLIPHPQMDSGGKALRWPSLTNAVSVQGLAARLCEEPDSSELSESPADLAFEHNELTGDVGLFDAPVVPLTEQAKALIKRWPGGIEQAREVARMNPSAGPPPTEMLALLEAQRIPIDVHSNALGSGRIRIDASFDHLSLLSVRSPEDFARIARAATGTDLISRRVQAHAAYIDRRFLDAAATYADLLGEQPDDTDLWRDVCWALRHAGREELVRAWVLNPTDVVQVASTVAWQAGSSHSAHDESSLDRLIGYLEWITHALRTR